MFRPRVITATPLPIIKDWRAVAARSTRAEFVAKYQHPFLVALSELAAPERPQQTAVADETGAHRLMSHDPSDEGHCIFAVVKVTAQFQSMITVGRTANNDIVVRDVSVSRVHAFFRIENGRHELIDAGSKNGTFVNGRPLEPHRTGYTIVAGAKLRFGSVEFTFTDAAGLWERSNLVESDW